jgi:hypothetical protein
MLLDLANCPAHGWLSHAVFHEAGHAVAAVHLGFEFVEVVVPPPAETLRGDGPNLMAAGVLMRTAVPSEWVGERYEDAAIFLLAGSVAENAGFGHMLPTSSKGDMSQFANGTPTLPEAEKLAYIRSATPATRAFVNEHFAEIGRVAKALSADIQPDEHGRYFGFDSPLRLSYDEVRSLVLNGS